MIHFQPKTMQYFNNKKVLITGASSGIGKEFAIQLAGFGAELILVARREVLLQKLAANLKARYGTDCLVWSCDLVNDQELDQLINKLKDHEVDILINNAGKGSFGYFEELSIEDEVDQVKLNIIATQRLAHAVIPSMKLKKAGAIITVSSIAAFQPLPLMATYAGTKGFNYLHSVALRAELKEFGVQVLTLCPGMTATEFGGVARVPGTISGGARDSVEMVVGQTIKALINNKSVVITGIKGKMMAAVSHYLPKSISTWFVYRGLKKSLLASKIS